MRERENHIPNRAKTPRRSRPAIPHPPIRGHSKPNQQGPTSETELSQKRDTTRTAYQRWVKTRTVHQRRVEITREHSQGTDVERSRGRSSPTPGADRQSRTTIEKTRRQEGGFPYDTWQNLVVSGVVITNKRILYESYFKEAISSLPEWCLKEAVSSLETAREKYNEMEKTNSLMFTLQEGRTAIISDQDYEANGEINTLMSEAWTTMISNLIYEVNGEIKTLMSGSGRDKIRMLTSSAQDLLKMVSLPNHGIQNLQQEGADASHLLLFQKSFRSIFLNLQTLLTEVSTGQNLPFDFETTFGMLNNGLNLVDKMGKTTASISEKLGTLVKNLKFRENILDKLLLKCSSNIPTVVESFLEKQRRTFIPVAAESNLFNPEVFFKHPQRWNRCCKNRGPSLFP